jgi:hypothetical protein
MNVIIVADSFYPQAEKQKMQPNQMDYIPPLR